RCASCSRWRLLRRPPWCVRLSVLSSGPRREPRPTFFPYTTLFRSAGNLLQQLYNVADTLIVGRFLGADALAAVGSAYSLMTFLTDRKSTRLNSSHVSISYAVFCLKKKK